MQCERSNIESIRKTKLLKIAKLSDASTGNEQSSMCMVSNQLLGDYRLILGAVKFTENGDLIMSKIDAKALQVDVGSQVTLLQIR
jgi:arginine/ornithine N-succinyltransferase beta subunit